MKDKTPQSSLTMVQIDGSRVRQLREEKGLTQLYLATAVEVTTDTISRWENRHYQSVKKENAQRLALALEVDLEVILEPHGEDAQAVDSVSELPPPAPAKPLRKLLLLSLLLAGIVVVVALVFIYRQPGQISESVLSATRKTPSHAMPGLPFPVVITVETQSLPLSVVIKESLPANIRLTSSSASLQATDKAELKWIVKHMAGTQRFGYMLTPLGPGNLYFQGTVTTREGRGRELGIGGRQALGMAAFHWADSNQDGIISDDEILVVYDDFEDVAGLTVDVELVEEMWMASGYRWDKDKEIFEIIP